MKAASFQAWGAGRAACRRISIRPSVAQSAKSITSGAAAIGRRYGLHIAAVATIGIFAAQMSGLNLLAGICALAALPAAGIAGNGITENEKTKNVKKGGRK